MPEQLSLPGFDSVGALRSTDRHHLFFAILPDSDTAARIERLARQLHTEHGLKRKLLRTERFHVTLHSIGTYPGFPRHIASWAQAAAATVAMPAFDVVFDHAGSFRRKAGDRPFVLFGGDVAALKELHAVLGTTLEKAGFKCNPTSSFTPHVTLLYDRCEVDERVVEPVRWTAREFVLMDSLVGKSQHVPLARWPLLKRSN